MFSDTNCAYDVISLPYVCEVNLLDYKYAYQYFFAVRMKLQ